MAALGLLHAGDRLAIFHALNPLHATGFVVSHGLGALPVMGSVFLAVTGAEALYADMGHFGRGPIRSAWLGLVFPALTLNYLGQGALVLARPETVANPFFLMAPDWVLLPLVAAGDRGDGHRQPGGDHRRLLADAAGDPARPAAAAAIRHTSETRPARSTCRRSTGSCSPAC